MDPKNTSQPMPEMPKPAAGGEIPKTPELKPVAPSVETAPAAAPAAPIVQIPAVPASSAPATPVATPPPATTDTPAIADDVDVIEKEWVDKAQDIINKTKTDPYQEEEQIEGLQVEYLKKRYGKDINKPAEGA